MFLSPHRRSHAWRIFFALAVLFLSAVPLQLASVSDLESDAFYVVNGAPAWLYAPIWPVMQLGNIFAVAIVAGIAVVTRRVRMALDVAVAGALAWLLANQVKAAVGRGRPEDLLDDVTLRGAPASGLGFVSGHAAVAAAVAAALTPYLSFPWKVTMWTIVAIVAFARIYVGAHFPLDVIGGAAMGWAIGSLVHFTFGEPRRAVA
jgi:glycosyltransferase 2 family protein